MNVTEAKAEPGPWTGRLSGLLYAGVVFTAAFPTLILYRAAIQSDYQWGLFGITGVGRSSGFWFVAAAAAWAWGTVYLGSCPPRRLFALLLVGWNGLLFGSIVNSLAASGRALEFRGDALGIRVNLAFLGPLLSGLLLLLSLVLLWRLWRGARRPAPLRRSKEARTALIIAAALLPIIVVLFSLGGGRIHTRWDRMAVAAVVFQCVALAAGLPKDEGRETKES